MIVDVKPDGLAEHLFGISQTDGVERAFEGLRCHPSELGIKATRLALSVLAKTPL